MQNNTGKTPSAISCGQYHTIVLMTDGTIYGTGTNTSGQLGDGTTGNKNTLTLMTSISGKTPSAISCGENHTIVLMTDGTIYGTGSNTSGQLGNRTTSNRLTLTVMVLTFLPANVKPIAIQGMVIPLDAPCFNEGTKILCLNKHLEEEYIPVENLRKGDFVKTYKHGFRKIDLIGKNNMINNPKNFGECMYKMEKTNENGLFEDLLITGWHSILVDDLKDYKQENDKVFGKESPKIDDKHLLLASVSKDFIKMENNANYTYYHFTLEGDDNQCFGVWANGLLTETISTEMFKSKIFFLL
jgi:hypothetical protein